MNRKRARRLPLTYEAKHDRKRLGRLLGLVLKAMRSRKWLTLGEIHGRTQYGSEAGISARVRELRKMGFGISRRRRPSVEASRGLFEYRLDSGRFRTI